MRLRQRALENLDQDILEHIDEETRDNIGSGMSAAAARHAALRKFGNVAIAKEDARGVWGWNWIEGMTKEIGIRIALGARFQQVIGTVFRETAVIVGTGLVLGLAGAFATTRLISTLLFGISATDPWTIVTVVVVLVVAAAIAAFLPARRAARVDPLVALKYE